MLTPVNRIRWGVIAPEWMTAKRCRYFQEWTRAGVFRLLGVQGLLDYDALVGPDWEWQAMDGAMRHRSAWQRENRSQSN